MLLFEGVSVFTGENLRVGHECVVGVRSRMAMAASMLCLPSMAPCPALPRLGVGTHVEKHCYQLP